jgi:inhibitor of cysteine peptidase
MLSLNETADGSAVAVSVGDYVEVTLAENRTTGYRWNLQETGEPVCDLVDDEFIPSGESPGANGNRRWRFKVIRAGAAAVEMLYLRPWESAPSVRRFGILIRGSE